MQLPIAIDALGGDHAPEAVVAGAVEAARSLGLPLILVGREESVRREMDRYDLTGLDVQVHHAPEQILMGESPAAALRKKRGASILAAAELVKIGRASALVSAGNSGAVMGAALMTLGTISGVQRPAIATILPSRRGRAVLLDAGANVDCRPRNLVQFAQMGAVYASGVLGIENPRVALLSIGEEPEKGDARTKAAHALLRESGLNFTGNIDGHHVFCGGADVVVCDGFTGNVVLKVGEGAAEFFAELLAAEMRREGLAERCGEVLKRLDHVVDYAEYGGGLLLGVAGVCVIAHGRSSAKAVAAAVKVAAQAVNGGITQTIRSCFEQQNPKEED
jgi:glycerol-3-phosphate acyltransferase PlsX